MTDSSWDTCGRWPNLPHAANCEWFRFHNLPEAKSWMQAAWRAHPHRLLSNPTEIKKGEAACETCRQNPTKADHDE